MSARTCGGAPWLMTADATPIDLDDPNPAAFNVENLARQLSRLPRFAGATGPFYSVAQHCVIASQVADPPHLRLPVLLHDAHEIVTGDIPRPVKRLLGAALADLERALDAAVARHWGMCPSLFADPGVAAVDARMFATEVRDLMPSGRRAIVAEADSYDFQIDPWPSEVAERKFRRAAFEILIAERERAGAAP